MLPLDRISPSKIKTFDTCKFKYWLTYFRPDISLKSNFGSYNGTLIHNILDKRSIDPSYDCNAAMIKGLSGEFEGIGREGESLILPSPLELAKPDDFKLKERKCESCSFRANNICSINSKPLDSFEGCPKDIYTKNMQMVNATIDKYSKKRWPDVLSIDGKKVGAEYKMSMSFPDLGVSFIGFFDLVSIENNEIVHIFDYKAGKKAQSEKECLDDWQVLLYDLVAHKEFVEDVNKKGFAYKKVILHFDYFQGQERKFEFTDKQRSETYKALIEEVTKMKSCSKITRIAIGDKFPWQCNALCDIEVCKKEWTGAFNV